MSDRTYYPTALEATAVLRAEGFTFDQSLRYPWIDRTESTSAEVRYNAEGFWIERHVEGPRGLDMPFRDMQGFMY